MVSWEMMISLLGAGCHSFQFRTLCSLEGTVHTKCPRNHRKTRAAIEDLTGDIRKPSEFAVHFFRKHLEYQSGTTSLSPPNNHTSPLKIVRIWVDDFPAFLFGGICSFPTGYLKSWNLKKIHPFENQKFKDCVFKMLIFRVYKSPY